MSKHTQRTRVGARTPKEIIEDPQATAEEIRALAIGGGATPTSFCGDPIAAVQHPNCPEDLWWQLAVTYPIAARASLLFQILTLESPERWLQLEREELSSWISKGLWSLPGQEQRLFAADCAEHVLPFFQRLHPRCLGPRRAIVAARSFARGVLPPQGSQGNVYEAARAAADLPSKQNQTMRLRASCAAMSAAAAADPWRSALSAAEEALYKAADAAMEQHAERRWQWEHLQEYLAVTPKRGGLSHIGAREIPWMSAHAKEIMANPQATPDDIKHLRGIEQVSHPNCPAELWWTLAEGWYPMEAEESALYDLMTLESPGRWEAMERVNIGEWIRSGAFKLSPSDQRSFAIECAERVLPIWEKMFPRRKGPRLAIEAARALARGQLDPAAQQAAFTAANRGWKTSDVTRYRWVNAAAAAAATVSPQLSPSLAAIHAAHHANGAAFDDANSERKWQWRRMKEYLKGEVPSPPAHARMR